MEKLKTDHSDGILTITLSRPEALNALNLNTLSELITVLQQTYESNEIKGVILTGEGEKAGTQRLTQLTGRGKALELMLTGDMISAQDAKTIGLVNHVVPLKELMATARSMMGRILGKGPIAIANVIESVNAGFNFASSGYEAEAENFAACTTTRDLKRAPLPLLKKDNLILPVNRSTFPSTPQSLN